VKTLGQGQQTVTFSSTHTCEHDCETRHEEAWTCDGPSSRIAVARHAQFYELLFVFPMDVRWEMTVRSRVRRLYFQDTKPRPNGVCQRSQCLEIAGLSAAKTRQGLFANLGAVGPFGVG
jgi:hypothetical protein